MNWPAIVLISLGALAVIGFLTWLNIKDGKKFEKKLNRDYRKRKNEEGDTEIDETMK